LAARQGVEKTYKTGRVARFAQAKPKHYLLLFYIELRFFLGIFRRVGTELALFSV